VGRALRPACPAERLERPARPAVEHERQVLLRPQDSLDHGQPQFRHCRRAGKLPVQLGCPSDWDPSCLRSWLQDPDGDGIYTFETTALPKGSYEAKVAINESWDENYGAGGMPNGPNISFGVPYANPKVTFRYDAVTD